MRARVRVALVAWTLLLLLIGGYGLIPATVQFFHGRDAHNNQDRMYGSATNLVAALQQERQLSLQAIGDKKASRGGLESQREATNRAVSQFQGLVRSAAARDDGTLSERIEVATSQQLAGLEAQRAAIDAGSVTQDVAMATYTGMIKAALAVFPVMPASDEPLMAHMYQTVIAVENFREAIAAESALLAGATARGSLTASDQHDFAQLAAVTRFLQDDISSHLRGDQRDNFAELVAGTEFTHLRDFEDTIVERSGDRANMPLASSDWAPANIKATDELGGFEVDVAKQMLNHSDSESTSSLVWAGLITLAVLLVGMGLMVLWFRVAPRHVLHELIGLQRTAQDFAVTRLPSVVSKLQRGERVDSQAEVPPLEAGNDEFGDVSRAFNSVRQVAVQAAVDQAELRNGIRDVFVNLARRSQSLVHRQLLLLDKMERNSNDSDELERLFELDHLATRLRRHAEDLIILSGSAPGRQWRKPVPMIDVIRSAVGETEAYSRVNVVHIDKENLSGRLVADAIPLFSALIDNATAYSPPQTKVRIVGTLVPSGFVVEIEDSGLGMSDEERTRYNQKLAEPPEFNLSDTMRLGLFVVAHLANRHGVSVTLRRSPYGGTTAIVLIPSTLLASQGIPEERTGEHDELASGVDDAVVPVGAPSPHVEHSREQEGAQKTHVDVRGDDAPRRETAQDSSMGKGDLGALPRRERQASLAEELRRGRAPYQPGGDESSNSERSPEQIREMMSTFQRGSVQGDKAAQNLDLPDIPDVDEPETSPTTISDAKR